MVNNPDEEHTNALCAEAKTAFASMSNIWWQLADVHAEMNRVTPCTERHMALRREYDALQVEWSFAFDTFMEAQSRFIDRVRELAYRKSPPKVH